MTRLRAPARVLALAVCLTLCVLAIRSAQAQDAGRDDQPTGRAVHFDLPAQPLAQMLQAFGRMTNLVVLAPAPLLDGRISAALSGDYSPREALQRVLAGTGLRADFTGSDEALIVAEPVAAPAAASEPAADPPPIERRTEDNDLQVYAAMVQARLTEVLCARAVTRPGGYRLVAQLRIDGTGAVMATDLVASSGLASRDKAIEQALRTLKFDSAPPPGLPEPITILLRPTGNGVHMYCPPSDERG